MIVRPIDGQTRLISQHDHARVAGTFARHWIRAANVEPPAPELRGPIFFAVDNHDVGWCKPDTMPQYDAETRYPSSFFSITAAEATSIWSQGIDFCADYSSFSGYLVSWHFCLLAESGVRGAPPDECGFLRRFIEQEKRRQSEFVRKFTPEENAVRENAAALLRACDTLSLLVCRAPEITPPQGKIHVMLQSGIRVRPLGGELIEVGPWPFDLSRLEVKFPGLTVQGGPFDGEDSLEEALEWAEPGVFVSRLAPLQE